jgi:hypothetical protein
MAASLSRGEQTEDSVTAKAIARVTTLTGVLCLGLGLAAAAAPSQAASSPGWRVVSTITSPHASVSLSSIAAVSAKDAWAVGSVQGTGKPAVVVVRWNGRDWRRVILPAAARSMLGHGPDFSVAATSASDVWISGPGGWAEWNGHAWRTLRMPDARRGESSQTGQLLLFGPRSAWLIGTYSAGGAQHSFARSFNGRRWRTRPAPGLTGFALSASSASSICAVNGGVGSGAGSVTRLACWNGHHWRNVPLPPSMDESNAVLSSILVRSLGNVWVGGSADASSTGLAAHWNGHSWQVATLPVVTTLGVDDLSQLDSDGHGGMWAVGNCDCGGPAWRLWHYTGGAWLGPTLPAIGGAYGLLAGIAAVPGTDSAWAAGTRGTSSGSDGVVLGYGRTPR